MKIASILILIVNYRTADLVVENLLALASVVTEAKDFGLKLNAVVVDNNSSDGSFEIISQFQANNRFSWCHVVQSGENKGFASANNIGLNFAFLHGLSSDLYFFLNPDAVVFGDTILAILRFFNKISYPVLVGCTQVDSLKHARPSAFRFPSILTEFQRGANVGLLNRFSDSFNIVFPSTSQPFVTDWVTGAAFVVPHQVLSSVGKMDEDFFLYYEEVELMWRIRRAGYEIWSLPDARVFHEGGASTGVKKGRVASGELPEYWFESWRLYFAKTNGTLYRTFAGIAYLAGCVVAKIVQLARPQRKAESLKSLVRFVRLALVGKRS